MRFLRKSTPDDGVDNSVDTGGTGGTTTSEASAQEPSGATTASKGRPTPKRREAEAKRRGPVAPPPRTRKEAAAYAKANRPSKEDRRAAAVERRERMAAGDDRFLMPRDRGPVKAYIRDVVDSRPHLMGLFMPLAVLVLLSVLLPIPNAQQYMSLFSVMALAVMILEGVWLGITTTRKTRQKFPTENINGLATGWYSFTRASQLRRLRIPKPRVARGANP